MTKLNIKLPVFGIAIVAFLPLYNVFFTSISINVFAILTLIYLFKDFSERWSPDYKNFGITVVPFGLYLFGLLYTNDIQEAYKVLEIGFPLFAFPFIYFILLGKKFNLSKNELNVVLHSILLSVVTYVVISILYLIYLGILFDFFNSEMLLNETQNRGVNSIRRALNEMPFIGEHPTYIALFSLVSAIISMVKFKVIKNFIYGITFLISSVGVFITGAKIGVIVFSLLVVFYLGFSIKWNVKKSVIMMATLPILVFSLFQVPFIKSRISQVFKTELKPPKGISYNSTNVRVGVYDCVINSVQKAPIIGYGTGGSKKEMTNCFMQYDTDIYARSDYYYNSHNQYLSFLLSNGIYGVILIVLWMLRFAISFFHKKSEIFFLIWLAFAFFFLTENILERQTGVVLFSLLIPLFYKIANQENVEHDIY